jgi:uncharacterized membrane protein/DNA-directed RNA polymerase subunit RPC12/RpoP
MPIEFRCTQCRKLLRTQDDTAGKQAKCPVCGTLVLIPNPASPPRLPADAAPPPARLVAESASPDGLPSLAADDATAPPRLEIGELLSTSWKILQGRLGLCIGATMAAMLVFSAAAISLSIPIFLASLHGGNRAEPQSMLPLFVGVGWWLVEILLYSLMLAGQAVFFLKIARGQPAGVADFFSGWRWGLTAFLVYLVAYLATYIGFLLLIVPGIIVALMFSQSMFLVVDRSATLSEALRMSRTLTDGHKLVLCGLFAIVWALSFVAAIPCYLGLIIFLPWKGLLTAIVYLRLTGEAVAVDTDA